MIRWLAVGAAKQGLIHREDNVPVQDKFSIAITGGAICVSLADGAGSAKFSNIGAEVVTNEIAKLCASNFDSFQSSENSTVVSVIRKNIEESISDLARRMNAQVKEFASTLLFVVIKESDYISGHLGDGVIVATTREGGKILSHPQHGEYINETYLTMSKNWSKYLRINRGITKNLDSFILMSDGAAESLYNRKKKSAAPALLQLSNWFKGITSSKMEQILMKNMESQIGKRTHDDSSILLLKKHKHTINSLLKTESLFMKEYLGIHRKDGMQNRLELIKCLVSGLSLEETASYLSLSKPTIYRHLSQIKNLGITI